MAIAAPAAARFDAAAAFTYTRHAVSFGERPSGSAEIAKLRDWIVSELRPLGGQLQMDSFTGDTPTGPVPMTNVILRFPGKTDKAIVVTGHYDTKKIPMVQFVGANDAGSSTGFLIEFAQVIAKTAHQDEIDVVFFDGEEAVGTWSDTDSTYGSRHLAAKWAADGTLSKIRALINVDMIGDKNLDLANDSNSSQQLRTMLAKIATRIGDEKYFRSDQGGIEDDHMPFVNAGVNAIDIIDLDYGPNMAYWHTAQDTMDKLSVRSYQVVGDLVLGLVQELDKQSS